MNSSSHDWKELSYLLYATSTFTPQNKIGGGIPQNEYGRGV